MKLDLYAGTLSKLVTQALIVPVPEAKDVVLPESLRTLIPKAAQQAFTGVLDQALTIFPATGSTDRIVLVGLGDGTGTRTASERFRRAIALGIKQLSSKDVSDIALYLGGLAEPEYLAAGVLMAKLAPYKYRKHKSTKEDANGEFRSLTVVAPEMKTSPRLRKALEQAGVVADAVIHARDLVNSPSNSLTPTMLAGVATTMAKQQPNLTATVLGEKALTAQKFGALLAVARGSDEEAQLITLEYAPKVESRKSKVKTVVLVGKGITFDTGGLNLKPSSSLDDMHMDMAGGAAVLTVVSAVAALDLPIHVVGIVPASENMPSGSALKPGDVITSRSGLTIEVRDTDAEGRLVLSDGLDHAKSFKPDLIIDIATLTGAVIIALGEDRAAVIGNNQELVEDLMQAGERTGELLWQLPLDDDYRAYVKSEVADVNNIGKGRGRNAGTIAGAAFLEKFVPKDVPWAHIDIGGTGMKTEAGPYWPKGGTGWGVQLLVDFLTHLSNE